MFKRWYGRDNPLMRAKLADTAFVATLTNAALEAERAVRAGAGRGGAGGGLGADGSGLVGRGDGQALS